MPSKAKKIWNIISTVLVALVVVVAVLLVGARVIGLRVFNVVSGSMAPTYQVGDLIYVKSMAGEDFEVGMPITYVMDENLVVSTHRVVAVDLENKCIYTKGDANDAPDAPSVDFRNVIGTPVFRIPYLGFVAKFIQSPPGSYIAIVVGAVLLIAVFLPDLLGKKKKTVLDNQTGDTDVSVQQEG